MKFRCFLLHDLFFYRNFSLCCRLMKSKDRRKPFRNNQSTATNLAFPAHFENKIRNWRKLIDFELKERSVNIQKEGIFSSLSKLKLINVKRNIHGRVAFFKPSELENDETSDLYRAISMINCGAPVTLELVCPEEENSEDAMVEENNLSSASTNMQKLKNNKEKNLTARNGVVLGLNDEDGSLMVKLLGNFELNDEIVYRLKYYSGNYFLVNLQELLSERKNWLKYPGYKLMLYAYRARQLPVAYSERLIKLPKEFNEEQSKAISAALDNQRPITAILGPPGTGKTKVIGQIIAECIQLRKKVLVCAPSHKALDNIMDVCKKKNLHKYCKLHGEERVDRYLSSLIKNHNYYPLLNVCYEDLNKFENTTEYSDTTDELKIRKRLISRANSMERQIQMDIAADTKILLCTLSSITVHRMLELGFSPDLTIIDEAGQAMEVETWPMLFQAHRAVIVGDHKQLSPIVWSERGKKEGLDISLLQSLANEHGKSILFTLREQYRSNELIQRWSSQEFYNGLLKAHPICANIHLRDLLKNTSEKTGDRSPITSDTTSDLKASSDLISVVNHPLVMVNTDLIDSDLELFRRYHFNAKKSDAKLFQDPKLFREKSFNHSIFNRGEAWICAQHLIRLVQDGGLDPQYIGCITPYTAQIREVRSRLRNINMDVSSVDGFQGQEREVIVMSFVRNNNRQIIGFLEDLRRMNVAITRARRQFFIVASARMMQINAAIGRLYEIIRDNGCVVSPAEILFPDDMARVRRTIEESSNVDNETGEIDQIYRQSSKS